MKRILQLALLIMLLAGALAAVAVYVIASRGVSAREEPSGAETFIARRLRHLAIPRNARDKKNPVTSNPEMLAGAMEHFADHCAICHGNDGRGETLIGRGLYPKPPDMTQSATQQLTDGEIYAIIENGVRFTGMPAFGEEHGEGEGGQESWELVGFIRHLPSLTADEIAAMKKMNPKSPREIAREDSLKRFLEGDDNPPTEDNAHHH